MENQSLTAMMLDPNLTEEDRKKILAKQIVETQNRTALRVGLPFLHGFKWYKWAKEFFDSKSKICLLTAANQISKAVWVEEKIPTPSGMRRFGDLKIGDYVYSKNGKPTKIVDIPFRGFDDSHEFTFHDGSKVVTSKNHAWTCKTEKQRFRKTYTARGKTWDNPEYDKWVIKSTEEILEYGENPSPRNRIAIPMAEPVENYSEKMLNPYLLGLLIGDGGFTSRSVILTSADKEIQDYIVKNHGAKPNGKFGFRLNGYQEFLRNLDLMGLGSADKFIPEKYLMASIEDRMEILKGLMDSDGTVSGKTGAISYTTVSEKLKNDFCRLVTSLGGFSDVKVRKTGYKKNGVFKRCKDAYHITIKIPENPFKLTRKKELVFETRYRHERVLYSSKPVGKVECMCISVDAQDETFLITENHIVTHNSSTQIRKCINWATDRDLWPDLWVTQPNLFWYLYPTQDVINIEFETKWKQFLPRGVYQTDPYYGWEVIRSGKDIAGIRFYSGVTVLFKTYGQNVHALQSSTVYAMFCDEELPIDLFDELIFRLTATDGYFSMVFTATRGQDEWRRAMEPGEHEIEFLPEAFKMTVSMYDCMQYEDGSQSPWTRERILEKEMRCSSHNEILKRIHGKFILDEGALKYESFDHKRHIKDKHPLPKGWNIYVGIDIGSGGAKGHPSAICYLAVNPTFTEGRIFAGWRGDKIITTAGDVVEKNIELKKRLNIKPTRQFYDWASKDFYNIATRMGEAFEPAEKNHDVGEDIVNTLFKNDMLFIYRDDELVKLTIELGSIRKDANKKHAKDDFIDAMRYAASKVPWDFTNLGKKYDDKPVPEAELTPEEASKRKRLDYWEGERQRVEDEFAEWNDLY